MIESCPQCGYSLRGLPAEHRCPECGLKYDADSEVYRHRRPPAVFLALGAYVGVSGILVSFPAAGLNFRFILCAALIVVSGVAIVCTAIRVMRNFRRGPLVAVLPDGLYVRLEREETIPWQNITLITGDDPKRGVVVYCGKIAPYLGISGVFRTRADVERFVGQVRARRSRPSSWDPLAGSTLAEVPADPP